MINEALLKVFLFFLSLLMCTSAVQAQAMHQVADTKAQVAKSVLKVIPVKYANVNHVASLVGFFGATTRPDPQLRVITIAGDPATVAAVEEAVRKLDVPPAPPRDIVLTAYVLIASRQAGERPDLPSSLNAPVAQLKRVLDYRYFHLVNTLMLRTQEGGDGTISGVAAPTSPTGKAPEAHFTFGVRGVRITREGNALTVSLRRLSFYMAWPESGDSGDAQIGTGVDIPEGQEVVVGKSPVSTPGRALVLVVAAKIVM
jgi:hypothetical protein